MRKLGNMGEHQVLHWANERGISANKSEDDSGGWDIFMQFPQNQEKTEIIPSLDISPSSLSCLLQVKTTDKRSGRINGIKLGNWRRLVETPIPSFFLVLEYDGQNDVQRTFIVHVDKILIEKVLGRLRKIKNLIRK